MARDTTKRQRILRELDEEESDSGEDEDVEAPGRAGDPLSETAKTYFRNIGAAVPAAEVVAYMGEPPSESDSGEEEEDDMIDSDKILQKEFIDTYAYTL